MSEITKKQLAANRQNALKSTGPRTPKGKAIVALNPVKHGLLSKELVIADEDETALVEMGKRLRHSLAPVGEPESLLADRVIAAWWRIRRIFRIEREMMNKQMEDQRNSSISFYKSKKKGGITLWEALDGDLYNSDALGKLMRYEAHIERGMYKALHELQRLQAGRSGQVVPPPEVIDVDISGHGDEAG